MRNTIIYLSFFCLLFSTSVIYASQSSQTPAPQQQKVCTWYTVNWKYATNTNTDMINQTWIKTGGAFYFADRKNRRVPKIEQCTLKTQWIRVASWGHSHRDIRIHWECRCNYAPTPKPELPKEKPSSPPAIYRWYQLDNSTNIYYNINTTWGKKIGYCNAKNEWRTATYWRKKKYNVHYKCVNVATYVPEWPKTCVWYDWYGWIGSGKWKNSHQTYGKKIGYCNAARDGVISRYRRKKKYPADYKCFCSDNEEYISEIPDPTNPTAPPIVTKSISINIPHSCDIVESEELQRSTCHVDSIDTSGKVSCTQTAQVKKIQSEHEWECKKTFTYQNGIVIHESFDDPSCPDETKQPLCTTHQAHVNIPDPISHVFQLQAQQPSESIKYANFIDTISFPIVLTGWTTQQNKAVVFPDPTLKNITLTPSLYADTIGKTGNAVDVPDEIPGQQILTNGESIAIIPLKSRTPIGTNSGKIEFDLSGYHVVLSDLSYIFQKPFIGILEGNARLWTQRKYTLTAQKTTNLDALDLNIHLPKHAIGVTQPDLFHVEDIVIGAQNEEKKPFFARINSTSHTSSLAHIPALRVSPFAISYTLGWQKVSYSLSAEERYDDTTPIINVWESFLGAQIIGKTQKTGNTSLMWENFSTLSTETQRSHIRQYAYKKIKSRTQNTIVQKIKYVQGDITLPDYDFRQYDTLIVENGNVFIKENIPKSQHKNIIVLKNNYNVRKDFSQKGNILISPQVTEIYAFLYADGALLSTDKSGRILQNDTPSRSYILKNQLHIYGSIFSRNTLGGALRGIHEYQLPGWSSTDNFHLAMIYDLNYLRRGNIWCDKNANMVCTDPGEYQSATVIHFVQNTNFMEK